MTEPTRFTALEVKELLRGSALAVGVLSLSKAADYSLAEGERINGHIKATMTAASKTLTLGLADGQVAIVKNAGATNAFTVKNVSDDTGVSLAAGKSLLVIADATASTFIALD